jgi:hypothetical protein
LRRGDRHRAVGRARPQEAAPFQPLREQAGSLAVMPDHLQQVASATTKAKQLSAQRIRRRPPAPAATGLQSPSSCQCGQSPAIPARRSELESWQRFKPTHDPQQRLHVYVAIDNNAPAVPLTISIRRQPVPVPFSGCSGTITAGTNPAMSPSRPSRYALRQANSSWLEIPCRRAVADASRGAEKLSSTLFCGRPSTAATRVNNFKPTDMASVSKVIHTNNQLHAGQFGKTA